MRTLVEFLLLFTGMINEINDSECKLFLIFVQHVIVMAIQMIVNMMLKLIIKDYRSIFMETMKVEVFVRIVNTILKESIAISVNKNIIDHMENIGMKLMFVDVCVIVDGKEFFFFVKNTKYNDILEFCLQLAIVTDFIRLVIVKRKPEDVNAKRNFKSLIVHHVHLVILAIQIAAHGIRNEFKR